MAAILDFLLDNLGVLVGIPIAFLSFLVALRSLRHSRRLTQEQMLLSFMEQYSSPEMGSAIQYLYDFERWCKEEDKTLREGYDEIKLQQEEEGKVTSPGERQAHIEHSLHYRRRMVSHFYTHLYIALKNSKIPIDETYKHFMGPSSIIPEIILMLDMDSKEPLVNLYDRLSTTRLRRLKKELNGEEARHPQRTCKIRDLVAEKRRIEDFLRAHMTPARERARIVIRLPWRRRT